MQSMKHQRVGPASSLDQATWQQILTAAKALFFAKGYKGVSMKEIADAVQVMPSALYYHFPKGKEDLFTKMIQTLFVDEGVAGIDQAIGATQGLRERLTLLTTSLLTLPIDEYFMLLLRDAREHIKGPGKPADHLVPTRPDQATGHGPLSSGARCRRDSRGYSGRGAGQSLHGDAERIEEHSGVAPGHSAARRHCVSRTTRSALTLC